MLDKSCQLQTPPANLNICNATLTLGNAIIWSDANVRVRPGEFVAVLGPNGAGKSSLLKAILGELRLKEGSIAVDPLEKNSPIRVGYLPQRRHFDGSIRIRAYDVVEFGLNGTRWGIPLPAVTAGQKTRLACERAQIEHALARVGASSLATRPIGELSGGEQQRVLIAQAIVHHPSLLLLDEPFDSLDLPTQHTISALLRDIANESGMSVVMVAHDINPILPYLDQAVFIANGHVAAGAIADVVTNETLSRLYATPIEVIRTPSDRLVVVGAPDTHTHHAHG